MLCASLDTDPRTIQDCAPSSLNFPRRNCHKKTSQLCETDITTLVSHGDSHKVRHGVSLGVVHEVSLSIGLYKHVLVSDIGSVKGLSMTTCHETSQGVGHEVGRRVGHGFSLEVSHGVGPVVSLAIGPTEQVYVRAARNL